VEPTFTRPRASPPLRFLLRVPRRLYIGPLADLLASRCVLLLTTRGRRSGQPRQTLVSFMPLIDGRYVVFSGWGVHSDWYLNVRADPRVRVNVGQRQMDATARLVEDPEQRRGLMLRMASQSSGCGPPRPIRPLLKLTRVLDYEGEIQMAVAAGGTLPVVEIRPDQPLST
jgi:deazaflavin-dependent oxidoreductase (nitroreductase family)